MLKNEQFDLPLAFQNNWKPKAVQPVDHVSSFKKDAAQQAKKLGIPPSLFLDLIRIDLAYSSNRFTDDQIAELEAVWAWNWMKFYTRDNLKKLSFKTTQKSFNTMISQLKSDTGARLLELFGFDQDELINRLNNHIKTNDTIRPTDYFKKRSSKATQKPTAENLKQNDLHLQ